MADVRSFDPTKDTSVRRDRASTSAPWQVWKQNSAEDHLLAGFSPGLWTQYISLLDFNYIGSGGVADVEKLLKAELHLYTSTDHSGFKTAKTTTQNILIQLLTEGWDPVTDAEGQWGGAIDQTVGTPRSTPSVYGHISDVNLHENIIDVTPLLVATLPDDIRGPDNQPCRGITNWGWRLNVSGTSQTSQDREWVVASKDHPNIALHPFLTLTVELKSGPGVTVLVDPNGNVAAGSDVFLRGEYEPGAPGDIIAKAEVRVTQTPANGGGFVWGATETPDSTGIETSTFAIKVVPTKLLPGITYEWTARVTNQSGDVTPYASPKATIRYSSTVPTLSAPTSPVGTVSNLLAKPFRAQWSSPSQKAAVVQVQLRSLTSPSDPLWADAIIWDSGRVTVPLSVPLEDTTPPPYIQNLSVSYGGPLLSPGTYSYRMQAKDRYNAETDWKYGQVQLTAPYVVQPGGETDLTQYGRDLPSFRICIYGMGADRGPGTLLAELTDASNVGASEFYNSGGEFFFTLPAIHPQVAVIEPYQCHYSLDFHTPEGWRPKAFGLITDFDATEDEVIFYGMDYPAVLARLVEERFDVTSVELTVDKGGAKYSNKTIDYIIKDQLNAAKNRPNSPVKFITIGDVYPMNEKVTIYASFKQRLPFISGLIDSSRAGTGRKTRLVCERDATGAFRWRVLENPGIDRDNLRLEYGGLIQGFRTVPFSGWGTAVDAIGRTVLGTQVLSARQVAPGVSETTYGAWSSVALYEDIDDINDLRRRASQAAAQIAKVGKLMGLGIRVGSLGVKDMWDICDSVPIDIRRGVVDTSRFGSGYWTIWGWSWRSYPDGHSDLNLTLAPKQDTVPPNPDLIPSKPILDLPIDRGPGGIVTKPPPPPPVNPLCATPAGAVITWPVETDVWKTIWCGILEPSVDFTEQFTITGGSMYDSPGLRWTFHPMSGPDYTVPIDNLGPIKPENGPNIGPGTRRFASMGMGGVDYAMITGDNSGNVPGAAYRTAARWEYRGRGASSGFTISNVIIKQRGIIVPQTP